MNCRGRVKKTTGLAGLNRRLKYYYYKTLPDLRIEQMEDGFVVVIHLPICPPAEPERPAATVMHEEML